MCLKQTVPLCGEGREQSDHVDRWKPLVTEAKHVSKPGAFPVCRQAKVQFFNELEIGTGGGRSAKPFPSVGFTQQSEGACYVRPLELVYALCFLLCRLL